jgi:aspartate carbamoyltransferase catalytic subunit
VSHPTQGLLDLLTIKRHKSNFQDIKVTIVGDIKHSRVARSLVEGLTIMGTGQISLVSPNEFKPDMSHYQNADHTDDLAIGLKQADAVVALRVQKERIQELNNDIDSGHYFEAYGLTDEKIANCNDKVIVMHPGPMNRGIEISNEVADGPHSVINEQVTNGIAMRMALLSLIQSRHSSS